MIKKVIKSIIIEILFVVPFISILTKNVLASSYFVDDFNSSLNNWIIYSGTESSSLNLIEGVLRTYRVGPRNANFIEIKSPLPSMNLRIEIKFRFITNGSQGAGLGVNDTSIGGTINHQPLKEQLIANIWPQAVNKVGSTVSICLETDTNCSNQYTNVFEITQSEANSWHIYRIDYVNGYYDFYLDDIKLARSKFTLREPKYIWFGNPENTTQDQTFSEFWFDYVRVSEISEDSLPSWYMSQRDPLWKDNEYDHANSWNPGGVNTIERYGCAMTSAAMIMGKSGIQESDLSNIDPGELNAWLISQKDGYLGNGLTNWIAIARHVKEVVTDENKNRLEFNRVEASKEKVDELLSAGFYAIVNLGGHFVVIYDTKDNDNWLIADPYVADHTTLSKTTNLVSAGYYSPSKTDLSYFLFTSNPNINIQLTDSNGQLIPLIRTVESIKDEVTGISSPELAIYTLAKPITGKYIMNITSDEPGVVEVYLYDTFGEVKTQSINVDNKETIINYDKSDVDKSIITIPDTILPDIAINTPPLTNKRMIWGTATDNLGLRKVEIAIMPKLWWKVFHNYWANTYGTNDWKMFLPYFPDDSYRVRARSIDLSNNKSKVVEKYITLDTTSPKVWGDIAKIGSKRNVRLEASDKNGIEKIEFKWDKNKEWETYQNQFDDSGRILYYRAIDKAGNVSSVKSMYVR